MTSDQDFGLLIIGQTEAYTDIFPSQTLVISPCSDVLHLVVSHLHTDTSFYRRNAIIYDKLLIKTSPGVNHPGSVLFPPNKDGGQNHVTRDVTPTSRIYFLTAIPLFISIKREVCIFARKPNSLAPKANYIFSIAPELYFPTTLRVSTGTRETTLGNALAIKIRYIPKQLVDSMINISWTTGYILFCHMMV